MNAIWRYVLLVTFILFGLHLTLSYSHEGYGQATSLEAIKNRWQGPLNRPSDYPPPPKNLPSSTSPKPSTPSSDSHSSSPASKIGTKLGADGYYYYESPDDPTTTTNTTRRAKAAFVILARNGDLRGVIESIKQNEDRFNKKYKYPYVFLNEVPFTEEFKKLTTEVVGSEMKYGLIPSDHWNQAPFIDETKATAYRKQAEADGVMYGGSLPYRNMCRYNSGFFFRHELLKEYRYYWRIEPGVKFFCDLDYDPFLFMQDNDKAYGFTISLYEYENTIPTLWKTVKEFIKENPDLIAKDNLMQWLSNDWGETYTRCHFWSNFEIGDLDFWRSDAYMRFFTHLEMKGGFYYERWGDAPVHSIGAGLLLPKDKIHFFKDIGYRHEPFQHCPQGDLHGKGKCWCDVKDNFDFDGYSCTKRYLELTVR